ncbi:DUF1266 domain-containing protein [Gordonia sp. DT30]|uniref:DUF1266 domain-containing protein n=1 Tax=unclassified Gordonia (in: high G+C Gram-positive bacteria) TaxID=2657482 RepID=UPI003CEECEB8
MDQRAVPGPAVIDRGMVRGTANTRYGAGVYAAATSTVVTDPNGPLYDEHAQALALDAMSAVDGGTAWNSLLISGLSTYEARVILSRNHIDSTADWVAHLGECLEPRVFGDLGFVLGARAEMMRRDGHTIGLDHWLGELHEFLSAGEQDRSAHDAVESLCPAVAEVDEWIAETGLLPEGTALRSLTGMQCARVVTAVRWGEQSGYGDRAAVRQGLLAARDLAGADFADWAEFGTSTLAGWVLHEAPERRRAAWDAGLSALATLLTAVESPWRNLDFPLTADLTGLPDWFGDD